MQRNCGNMSAGEGLQKQQKTEEKAPADDQPAKKQKTEKGHDVYQKAKVAGDTPAVSSFFVKDSAIPLEAFQDNPGFVRRDEDSSGSSEEEKEKPIVGIGGMGLFGASNFSLFSSAPTDSKPIPAPPKLSNTSLFVPIPTPSKPVSLFDSKPFFSAPKDLPAPKAEVSVSTLFAKKESDNERQSAATEPKESVSSQRQEIADKPTSQ